ncbi:MAG: MFS transporter [Holosporaceae bacterium]|jgi:MFS family permease|nr:MFS transporter [Holosporaceae bacterium]
MGSFEKTAGSFLFGKGGRASAGRATFLLLFLNVVTSAAVSIYIPCMKQMAVDLNTTEAVIQMTIVAHLIGEFIGRILCGPLICVYGCRTVALPSLTLSALGHLGCMASESSAMFMAMRFIQAMGAGVIYVVSQSVINEKFDEKEKSGVIGIIELYQPIAWILSPFAGSILSEISNWRVSFPLLALFQAIGIVFFRFCLTEEKEKSSKTCQVLHLFRNYGRVLKNSSFLIYALIPGLFAGGYMMFATSSPFICSRFFGENSADIALFSAVPLLFYVITTFAYRRIVNSFGVGVSRRTGIVMYGIFGVYLMYLIMHQTPWTPGILLTLMCLQCSGSAFLVPVSVLRALQATDPDSASVGASTVVVFRNIIMSLCIAVSAKFSGSITTIMACVFMTTATVILLIMTRKIIRSRSNRKGRKQAV